MMRLDHLAISAATLAAGVDFAENVLGVTFSAGGEHPAMGTHNRLLGLGDLYLEVIAVNPAAPPPPQPRWFDLDQFSGAPRLTNWIVACDDLDAALVAAPPGAGHPMALSRGDLHWRMAVPADGRLPFGNFFPALIEWQGQAHPAARLPDSGVRLRRLEITHPQADALRDALPGLTDPRLGLMPGPVPLRRAIFATPSGDREIVG